MTARPRTNSDDPAEIARRVARNVVYCTRCHHNGVVDGAACLEKGWPRHCQITMSIDTPEERKAYHASYEARERKKASPGARPGE